MKFVLDGQIGVVDFVQYGQQLWTKLMMMDRACMVPRHEWIDPPSRCWHRPVGNTGGDEHWTTWMMW